LVPGDNPRLNRRHARGIHYYSSIHNSNSPQADSHARPASRRRLSCHPITPKDFNLGTERREIGRDIPAPPGIRLASQDLNRYSRFRRQAAKRFPHK